jgi:3-oxoacyl-[acyl-carrier protein] reductase
MSTTPRTCIVSGGSRGLGGAITAAMLAGGWQVAAFSRTATPMVSTWAAQHGPRFYWAEVDAEDPRALGAFVHETVRRFGRVDALVNNAGIMVEGLLTLTRQADIHRVLAINLEAAIVLAQAVAKVMLRQRHGAIVNISSVNAVRGHRGVAAYSAAKAGLDGFTRSLARELGAVGVTVNSVAPGHLATDLTAHIDEAQLAQIARRTPLGRLGTLDDVVGVVQFLLSPAAAFVTGQTIVVDGGLTC